MAMGMFHGSDGCGKQRFLATAAAASDRLSKLFVGMWKIALPHTYVVKNASLCIYITVINSAVYDTKT